MKKIHFMGIGGSGISGVAMLAKEIGYEITGCNMGSDTAYSDKLAKHGIKVLDGHDPKHLMNAEMLVVTPAVYFQNKNHAEFIEAKKTIPVMTWQEFLGTFLHKDKEVLAVAGTHGKSTTTALLSLIFEKAGVDPSVTIGATLKEWDGNYRYGKGKVFISEADEFFDNFLNYSSDLIILNNIEMDHPDFFKSEEQLFESYKKFVEKLKGKKTLILNQNSKGIKRLVDSLDKDLLDSLNIIGYSFKNEEKYFDTKIEIIAEITKKSEDETEFKVVSESLNLNDIFFIKIPGKHNVLNTLGVIVAAKTYEIDNKIIKEILKTFSGIGRRLELIGEKNDVKIYDDYAHHPTAIKATINALRQKYPINRIWVIDEAHSFSRTKLLLNEYEHVFDEADKVVIGPIFKARDQENFGISEKSIAEASKHKDISYFTDFSEVLGKLKKEIEKGDVILVMGAGESYKWAREIYNQ